MTPNPVSRAERYFALAEAFLPPKAGSPSELVLAYTRLFLGPGRPAVYLYESVYTEGQMMGAATLKVAKCYAAAGLPPDTGENEIPDHISSELAFMAKLAEREIQDGDQPKKWRDHQRRFLNAHLSRWLPLFVEKIIKSHAHPFYYEAALETKKLIDQEVRRLNTSFENIDPQDFKQSQSQPSSSASSVYKHSPRFPNIHAEVNKLNCTLCTLCADVCATGALSIERSPRILSLIFDPKTCNGCRACYRKCPEKAVSILRSPPLTQPSLRFSRVIATSERVICPSCQQPHISTSWLTRLVEQLDGDEAVRRALRYCPYCKISPSKHQFASKRSSVEAFDNV